MVTRNLDFLRGLVNGVEVVLTGMRHHSVTVRLPSGQLEVLPRINFVIGTDQSGLPFILHRRQFPLIPSFALTVHRVQGQSLRFVGLYFSGDVFCHGMLFTALSRARSWAHVKVFAIDSEPCILKNLVRRHIVAHLYE
jgi:ATP-dependent DNA helicase PIF1